VVSRERSQSVRLIALRSKKQKNTHTEKCRRRRLQINDKERATQSQNYTPSQSENRKIWAKKDQINVFQKRAIRRKIKTKKRIRKKQQKPNNKP
jgi:hypothetical protein